MQCCNQSVKNRMFRPIYKYKFNLEKIFDKYKKEYI